MRKWQKTVSGILAVGLLAVSFGNAALAADDGSGSVTGVRPLMQRGMGAILDTEQLSTLISELDSDTQREILLLAENLQALMPVNVDKAKGDLTVNEDTRTQEQAILSEIEAVFTANNITLNLTLDKQEGEPPTGEPPAAPTADAANGSTVQRPERPAFGGQSSEGSSKEGQGNGMREGKGGWNSLIQGQLTNLPEADQVMVQSLLAELELLHPQPTELTETEQAEMETQRSQVEAARTALTTALEAAGVTLPEPTASDTALGRQGLKEV